MAAIPKYTHLAIAKCVTHVKIMSQLISRLLSNQKSPYFKLHCIFVISIESFYPAKLSDGLQLLLALKLEKWEGKKVDFCHLRP